MNKVYELMEAELNDKITPRAKITFDALISAIIDNGNQKLTDSLKKKVAKELGINKSTLENYIQKAMDEKFLNKDGTVKAKYAKFDKGPKKKEAKVDDLGKGKVKKFVALKKSGSDRFDDKVFKLLSLMDAQASKGGVKNSIMLTGDPGVGKTSFIRTFAKLLGLPLITIEAPHISEEHIINIPFMIVVDDKVKKDNASLETAGSLTQGKDFEIVQSESNLVTKLKSVKTMKLKGSGYAKAIMSDKILKRLYLNYRHLIEKVRSSYDSILFLDEYYRNDNPKIRNILRNILNGRIGNDKIPKGTFIVYASNIDDEGVDDIPLNNDFAEIEFKAPEKDGWFDYILTKYVENDNAKEKYPGVDLKPEVFNKFYEVLQQEDLSFEDDDSEVRTSARRLEQLMLFVNASLPVKSVEEGQALLKNVEVNFRNYLDGNLSKLYPKYKKAVEELIEETSGITVTKPLPDTEWRDILKQQLEVKLKLDANSDPKNGIPEVRQYVPVISGEPGIGKTAQAFDVADELDLYFIHVDVSTLNRESVTGIPTAQKELDDNGQPILDHNGNPKIKTTFSKPELLDLIEKLRAEALKEDEKLVESKRKKGKGKYKFLLLFDELTRATPEVFNAIRKLMLEKSFNEDYDLPDDILVISALNPVDAGASELTKHMRDVLDIIPAKSSWKKTERYLVSEERPKGADEKLGFGLTEATVNAYKEVLNQYSAKRNEYDEPLDMDQRNFYLYDDGNLIYISPREITDLVTMANANIVNRLTEVGIGSLKGQTVDPDAISDEDLEKMITGGPEANKSNSEIKAKGIFEPGFKYTNDELDEFVTAAIIEFRDAFASKLSFICKKQEIAADNILSVTTGFIMKNQAIRKQYEGLKLMKVDDVLTLGEIIDNVLEAGESVEDNIELSNYIDTLDSPNKISQDLADYMDTKDAEIIKNVSEDEIHELKTGDVTSEILYRQVELGLDVSKIYVEILKTIETKIDSADKKGLEGYGQMFNNLQVFYKTKLLPYMTRGESKKLETDKPFIDKKAMILTKMSRYDRESLKPYLEAKAIFDKLKERFGL